MAQVGANNGTQNGHFNQMLAGQNFMMSNPMYYNNSNSNSQFMQMNSASPAFSPNNTPSSPMANTHQMDMLSEILQRLNSMDQTLTQLDTIQCSVTNLTERIDIVEQTIKGFEVKFQEIERSRQFDSNDLEEFNKKQLQIDSSLANLRKLESEQRTKEQELKRGITDLKCRSMRDNLLFFNIPEEKDENCENKILNLIEAKLGIENAKTEIKLQRVHRIGAFKSSKIRPIVAKF
ncbi:uncharacterized protein LOC128552179 [Mercenaria mercenaria]|uniref:uncharacterized protein LOC128552179 n=1 Tax=Mercenaria mercenaria TaxID=6596 RepID=UPI00234EEAF8|nr:uncharacterized protein LOC128552179 [Mercenaria mercenaria]